MTTDSYDLLVVGAGFAGAVVAERAASAGMQVLVVERRPHVGGNAFDELDKHGVLIHRYGPHIFHSPDGDIADYLSQFTEWRPYQHRVLANTSHGLLPIPINRTTLERFFGVELKTEDDAERLLESKRRKIPRPLNSEDVCLARVGPELYEAFFRDYTLKQWGRSAASLDASVCARIPVRTNRDDRYFTDTFQALPAEGYTALFNRMLDHRNIDVFVNVTNTMELAKASQHVVWTGPIDEAFDYAYGPLPWRSLRFDLSHVETPDLMQAVAVVNEPSTCFPFTRVTEYRHLTGQQHAWTSTHHEYPMASGEPYYPVPSPDAREIYKRYAQLADGHPWIFVGRLARYQYLEMFQVVGQALKAARELTVSMA